MSNFDFSFRLCYPEFLYQTAGVDDNHHILSIGLGFCHLTWVLPFKNSNPKYRLGNDEDDIAPTFGGYLYNHNGSGFPDSFAYYTKENGKYILKLKDFPWFWKFHQEDALDINLHWKNNTSDETDTGDLYKITRDFTYVTKNQDVQKTNISATLHRMIYIRKSKYLRFIPKIIYRIEMMFDNPIGKTHRYNTLSYPLNSSAASVDPAIMFPKLLNNALIQIQNEHSL